jgi:hypothetical protein
MTDDDILGFVDCKLGFVDSKLGRYLYEYDDSPAKHTGRTVSRLDDHEAAIRMDGTTQRERELSQKMKSIEKYRRVYYMLRMIGSQGSNEGIG